MKIKELTNEEFLNFSEHFPVSSPYQTAEYAMTMTKQKYCCIFFNYGRIIMKIPICVCAKRILN